MINEIHSSCLSKTSMRLKTQVPVQYMEGGVDFMESQYSYVVHCTYTAICIFVFQVNCSISVYPVNQ